eukprot:gene7704-biopygen3075
MWCGNPTSSGAGEYLSVPGGPLPTSCGPLRLDICHSDPPDVTRDTLRYLRSRAAAQAARLPPLRGGGGGGGGARHNGTGVARAWRGRGAGYRHFFGLGGAGVRGLVLGTKGRNCGAAGAAEGENEENDGNAAPQALRSTQNDKNCSAAVAAEHERYTEGLERDGRKEVPCGTPSLPRSVPANPFLFACVASPQTSEVSTKHP